jgi:hypothetical protein
MYEGQIPTSVAAGVGSATVASQSGNMWWLVLSVLCLLVAVFALLMASKAAWRMVPASFRRTLHSRESAQ